MREEVRPELGLHQDAKPRPVILEEALNRLRQVVGQVSREHRLAVEVLQRLAAGRGGAGHEDGMLGKGARERAHERLGGARLAHRDGVDPDELLRPIALVAAEALGNGLAVERLRAPAPPQPQQHERQRKTQKQRVERSHCSARSTSAALGGRPGAPKLVACGDPYSPVSAGSEPQ